jgi:hypothetical protein
MQTTLIITDMECPTCSHFLETKLGGPSRGKENLYELEETYSED